MSRDATDVSGRFRIWTYEVRPPENPRKDTIDRIWQLIDGSQNANLGTESHNLGCTGEYVANLVPEDC